MKEFDLLTYATLAAYSNRYVDKEYGQMSFKTMSVENYQQWMDKFFSKSFLNEGKKIESTVASLEKRGVDIVFFLEANANICKVLKETGKYYIISKEGI